MQWGLNMANIRIEYPKLDFEKTTEAGGSPRLSCNPPTPSPLKHETIINLHVSDALPTLRGKEHPFLQR